MGTRNDRLGRNAKGGSSGSEDDVGGCSWQPLGSIKKDITNYLRPRLSQIDVEPFGSFLHIFRESKSSRGGVDRLKSIKDNYAHSENEEQS